MVKSKLLPDDNQRLAWKEFLACVDLMRDAAVDRVGGDDTPTAMCEHVKGFASDCLCEFTNTHTPLQCAELVHAATMLDRKYRREAS